MWYKLDTRLPIDSEIIPLTVNGVDIFITKNNEQWYAVQDECPHEGIKLSLGCIKHNAIKCSLHGFSFDLAHTLCDEDGVGSITTYPIKYEQETLWIQMN